MPTFTDITTASLAVDKPITSAMMTALRDNALAAVWHPYNKATIGDTATGLIYDFGVSGAVSDVETPTFEDGYEYRIIIRNLSQAGAASWSLRLDAWREISASWVNLPTISDAVTPADVTVSGFVEFPSARASIRAHAIFAAVGYDGTASNARAIVADFTTAQKMGKARLNWVSGVNFDAGQIYLYRRGAFAV